MVFGLGCFGGKFSYKKEIIDDEKTAQPRLKGITERARLQPSNSVQQANGTPTLEEDYEFIADSLAKLVVFAKMDQEQSLRVASLMVQREIGAGEMLIREGDTGVATDEMYVVKSGHFEVLENRNGNSMRVNEKWRGDVFGELSLLFPAPRSATVAATEDSAVWVLERSVFRDAVRDMAEGTMKESVAFINSVPLLASLTHDERLRLSEALQEESFEPGVEVITQGELGETFYIIRKGEAEVSVTDEEAEEGAASVVNRLFRTDFFGETALLKDEPRGATVKVKGDAPLVCLTLSRKEFVEILGPLQDLMEREKSVEETERRMQVLENKPQELEVELVDPKGKRGRRKCRGTALRELAALDDQPSPTASAPLKLRLEERGLLGAGACGTVRSVVDASAQRTPRQYALKVMNKVAVMNSAEHVFCEQAITAALHHPFCVRQYASFQDRESLFLLLDLMQGGDLMDKLSKQAKVRSMAVSGLPFGKKEKFLQGMLEPVAQFYIASIVLALDYCHTRCEVIYRDLKPENVLLDSKGYIKLCDFGFAKQLPGGSRTYTFCGTPGYVSPETILGHGYNKSVDWWGLGVLSYVLMTGRQPFTRGGVGHDQMLVMKRIVDHRFEIMFPPYMSPEAQDLVKRFLTRNPSKRLGAHRSGVTKIKAHPFFRGLDWDRLEAKRVPSPDTSDADASRGPGKKTRRQTKIENEEEEPLAEECFDPAQVAQACEVFAKF